MAIEIERKYLMDAAVAAGVIAGVTGAHFQQAYLAGGAAAVRVRITPDEAILTVKSSNAGMSRKEWEYTVPRDEALAMSEMEGVSTLYKTRYLIPLDSKTFEVDVYEGRLAGLVTAEVELTDENETFTIPAWLGREVTDDKRYSNESLAMHGAPVPTQES
jgi:adenylate cyclase